jgi:hypothetical protein
MGKQLVKKSKLVGNTKQHRLEHIEGMPRERKFKVGYMTRVFEEAGKFGSKTDASDAAERLGDRYYTRITKIKEREMTARPKRYQLWKCKKPEWK